jgi:hypothetical protein
MGYKIEGSIVYWKFAKRPAFRKFYTHAHTHMYIHMVTMWDDGCAFGCWFDWL